MDILIASTLFLSAKFVFCFCFCFLIIRFTPPLGYCEKVAALALALVLASPSCIRQALNLGDKTVILIHSICHCEGGEEGRGGGIRMCFNLVEPLLLPLYGLCS